MKSGYVLIAMLDREPGRHSAGAYPATPECLPPVGEKRTRWLSLRGLKAPFLVKLVLFGLAACLVPMLASAADVTIPSVSLGLKTASDPKDVVGALQILFLLTILALAPSIMFMMTSFTRIIVVFGFLRQALGTQQMPPMQVLTALAIFMTMFIMAPTFDRINEEALK
ncbi:MAG TPA: hypothetical protein PLB81_05620, partial [Deltaproteobacteria bacterium]|nr:hypothetical protein [Deltaproteobacteria bacterium]